jgi:integrase/recombinase XerC
MSTALSKRNTNQLERARKWTGLADDVLKRQAAVAANEQDAGALWELLEAYLATYGEAGSTVSTNTVRAYRRGLAAWLEYAGERGVNLLRPARDTGADYVRHLERSLSPSSVRVYLAAVRMLYRALRWSQATEANPFESVKPARDKTAPWDKRQPYSHEEVEGLLEHGSTPDRVLVLLCAHAGLRVSEATALEWGDIEDITLLVRNGKGGKQRRVNMSIGLLDALDKLERKDVRVLPFTPTRARARLKHLAKRADVTYRGVHALRHYAGTRLHGETGSLEHTARHLGHSNLETTRVYAKWSDTVLRDTLAKW